MVKVLFVCMGNICRSPSAEGVFRALVEGRGIADRFLIDSCGTLDYHTGDAPDPRAQKTAKRRGIDISGLRGRQYCPSDFTDFDYILAMDHDNLGVLKRVCPKEHRHKLDLFCEYLLGRSNEEVPDPYYGGDSGFEDVYDLIEEASTAFLAAINDGAPQ